MDGANPQSLQLAYQQALDLAQFKAGFLARTSHELRSPLNRLISLHQLILNDLCDSPEEEREFIAESNQAGLELLSLLDQLVNISKVEIGRVLPSLDGYVLADILVNLETLVSLQVADRGMKLLIPAPEPTVRVWVDPSWLIKALTGLIEIAIETGQTGSIRIEASVHLEAQQAWLTLTDDRPSAIWETLIQDLQNLKAAPLNPAIQQGDQLSPASASVTLPSNPLGNQTHQLSPALRLFIAKQTLEATGIGFEILASPPTDPQTEAHYSLRCRLPLATPLFPGAPIETTPSQTD